MASEKKLVDLDLLTYYDGKIKDWTEGSYKIVEQATAETGYLKTYKLQVNGVDATDSVKINIPKDFMLKDAEIKTCTVDDQPIAGLVVGDKYFDFTINVADSSATATHVYLAVKDVFQAYVAGDGITITGQTIAADLGDGLQINSTSKKIEAKLGDGVQINSTSKAIEAKVGDGIEIDSSTKAIEAKVGDGIAINGTSKAIEANTGDGLSINATSKAIEIVPGDGLGINSTSKNVEVKPGVGLEINSSTKVVDIVEQDGTNNAPTLGGLSKTSYNAFNGAADTFSASAGNATAGTASGNVTPYTKTITVASTDVGGTQTADAFHFDLEWKEYGNATATSGQTAAAAGLMSGTDKDALDALVDALGTDVTFADTTDIDDLFATT